MPIVTSSMTTLVDLNDSRQLQLYIKSNQPRVQIFDPNTSAYTPNWPTNKPVLTPELYIAGTATDIIAQAKSIKWFVDGVELTASNTDYTLAASGVKTLTVNTNVLASANSKLFTVEVVYTDTRTGSDIVAKNDIEFVKVSAGQRGTAAITGVLSNETHTVPTLADGSGGVFTNAASTLTIYEGSTDVTGSWTIVQARTNVTVTEATSSRTATVTALSADTGSVTFTATRAGYSTITKTFNLTKSKQGTAGSNGTSPTAYWLVVDASALERNVALAYTPASIAVSAKSQVGTGTPGNYSARFIIEEQDAGGTWSTKYTSAANEISKTHTPTSNSIKAVRVKMYLAGGTTTLLDEQLIPVVDDGAEPVRAIVWTPEGNVVRNGNGSLKIKCDVYQGSTVKTAAYAWFVQEPGQSTDVGGGIGWKKLDATYNLGVTGYTTTEITVPASAIPSVESFKCVATFSGATYSDVATVSDVTDPISSAIVGGTTFKNGEGSVSMTCKLFQNGEEIDSAGTGYTYTWSLYNENNVKIANWNTTGSKVGKTITVAASDVSGRAHLGCDVSE